LRRRGLRTTLTSGFAEAAAGRSEGGVDLGIVATSIPCPGVHARPIPPLPRTSAASVQSLGPGASLARDRPAATAMRDPALPGRRRPIPLSTRNFFLYPQAGRIRQAGHPHDRIPGFQVLSPAAGGLSTGTHAVVNSTGELSPEFSTGSPTGALTACEEHAIVLPMRPPAGQRPSLCKGKAEREPENCRGSRHMLHGRLGQPSGPPRRAPRPAGARAIAAPMRAALLPDAMIRRGGCARGQRSAGR
jgi:hypothetical protein